jgi:phage terminase large subunit
MVGMYVSFLRLDVESGIKLARLTSIVCYFDKSTERLLECLKHYRRSINSSTNEPGAPLHDEYSHGADAFRYLCVSADKMTNETWQNQRDKI